MRATLARSRPSNRETARPRPLVAPVTTTTFLSRSPRDRRVPMTGIWFRPAALPRAVETGPPYGLIPILVRLIGDTEVVTRSCGWARRPIPSQAGHPAAVPGQRMLV